jgi:ABC-type bacteriocin/lantibiotic exporter with double-glycine peptidase domain
MTLKDYWLTLRQSIQEKLETEKPDAQQQEITKLFSELITPELTFSYKQLLKDLNQKTRKTESHPLREYIDINTQNFSERINDWIGNLIKEIEQKRGAPLEETSAEELRAQCWMLFDSVINVMNIKSLEDDIKDFYSNKKFEESDIDRQNEAKQTLINDLKNRYPFSNEELEILIDLLKPENDEAYSSRILVETISRLWREYDLSEKSGAIAKICLGYFLAKGVESFAPSLFQGIMSGDRFNVAVFLEFFGLNKIFEIIDMKTKIELEKVMTEINHKINQRIIDSLFFQEFEFIHEKSLGEIFSALERGKRATSTLLQDTISEFAPTLTGIAMSLAFLTKINPALGVIGIGSLPVMYKIARDQNKKIMPMYERERQEGEKISTRIDAITGGLEEVKTSANTPAIATHVTEQMDTRDTLSLQRTIEEIKNRFLSRIPFNVSTVIAAAVGGALQETGMISGGAVLSNIIYSGHLNQPVKDLVELYFNRFARYVQDIQRMDEIFGRYDKLDLPEGEKEKGRVPVSELSNLDISIRNLQYKGILRDVSLDIKQGEFITISGQSGAGKSTLLRNLAGLYRAESGEINIGGVKIDKIKKYGQASLYSTMSYCNQSPQIFEGMTLRENLLLWTRESIDEEKIKQVMRDLHLDKLIDKLDEETKHLSGGEKVRVGVARTLIKGAKIMLLDEPTASLDSQAATEVRKVLSEINEKYPDTTIVCVSHDEDLIKSSKRSINLSDLQK